VRILSIGRRKKPVLAHLLPFFARKAAQRVVPLNFALQFNDLITKGLLSDLLSRYAPRFTPVLARREAAPPPPKSPGGPGVHPGSCVSPFSLPHTDPRVCVTLLVIAYLHKKDGKEAARYMVEEITFLVGRRQVPAHSESQLGSVFCLAWIPHFVASEHPCVFQCPETSSSAK